MQADTYKAQSFRLFAHEQARAQEIERLTMHLETLPIDRVFHVTVRKGERGRREVANGLYQIAVGQVTKQHTHYDNPLMITGKSKYELLLPYKRIWAAEFEDDELLQEAELEHELCEVLASRYEGDKLLMTYDRAIRSKTLKVIPFSRYVDHFLSYWAVEGIDIKLRPSEKARAIN